MLLRVRVHGWHSSCCFHREISPIPLSVHPPVTVEPLFFNYAFHFRLLKRSQRVFKTNDWWHLARSYRPHPINRRLSRSPGAISRSRKSNGPSSGPHPPAAAGMCSGRGTGEGPGMLAASLIPPMRVLPPRALPSPLILMLLISPSGLQTVRGYDRPRGNRSSAGMQMPAFLQIRRNFNQNYKYSFDDVDDADDTFTREN